MRRITVLLSTFFCYFVVCQARITEVYLDTYNHTYSIKLDFKSFIQNDEPGTNVGKSLFSLCQVFPNIKFIKSDYLGDHYYDGEDPTEGVNCMFIVKNNLVVEECIMIQDTNGFPLLCWRSICDKFYNDSKWTNIEHKLGHYKFYYSFFSVDVIYIEENQLNTAMVVYKLRE